MVFHPAGVGPWEWALGLGLSLDVLPTELVESEQRLVPRLSGTFRWGMPVGFSLEAALDAVVLSNELRVGAAWAFAAGPLSFAIQDRVGLWFGYVGVQGFDTSAVGLTQYPGLAVGIAVGEHRLSLQGELVLVHAQRVDFGEASVSRVRTTMDGFSVRVLAESPVGPGTLYYGATVYRASPDFQLWLAFSDSRQKLELVRLVLGYEL